MHPPRMTRMKKKTSFRKNYTKLLAFNMTLVLDDKVQGVRKTLHKYGNHWKTFTKLSMINNADFL